MSESTRCGVWLIGARGSIATVTIAGALGMARGVAPRVALVSDRPEFADTPLIPLDDLVFGGHEVRGGTLRDAAAQVLPACGVGHLVAPLAGALDEVESRIRPGVVRGAGARISEMADGARQFDRDLDAIRAVRADLDAFREETGVGRIVVVNLASTEPPMEPHPCWADAVALEAALEAQAPGAEPLLPASALYAAAAFEGGDAYVNFTPSVGSRVPALAALAELRGAIHAGADGKTGETLVKSVLAELFARRGLPVLSWFGQNILGNEDGRILDDPENKASKVQSKGHVVSSILGYPTHSRVGIDYVPSLGEWKIAWDHIHFEGFLGGRMSMQFTWNGCDSLLAAPLVLDLARFTALAQARGRRGVLHELAAFFKDPMGVDDQRLIAQDEALLRWARGDT